MKIDIEGVSDPVYDIFNNYDWPGNIRELQNVIEYAFNFATTHTISIHDLPETLFDNDFMLSTNLVIIKSKK